MRSFDSGLFGMVKPLDSLVPCMAALKLMVMPAAISTISAYLSRRVNSARRVYCNNLRLLLILTNPP
jgi:hypothetical protein